MTLQEMEQEFDTELNPEHSLRTTYRIKGTRQKVIITYAQLCGVTLMTGIRKQ